MSDAPRGIADAKTPRERTAVIRRLMASGRWVTGVTGDDLSRVWRVTATTVRRYAAEASRSLREEGPELEDLRARTMATLETVVSQAIATGELRTAVSGIAELAKIRGLQAPTRVEASVGVSLDDIEEIRRTAEANVSEGSECSEPQQRSRKRSKKSGPSS